MQNPLTTSETNLRFAARGILIALVMLGHNKLFWLHFYYSLYLFIYAFHVGSFFLIAVLSPARAVTVPIVKGLARRVLLPFFAAVLVYWAFFALVNIVHAGGGLVPWMEKLALALSLENTWVLVQAAGLKMLWFLPTFFVFCMVYNVYGLTKGWTRYLFIAVAVVLHLFAGSLPQSSLYYVPWGANLVAFLILPSLLFKAIWRAVRGKALLEAGSIAVFAAASIVALYFRYTFVLADSVFADWHRPLALLLGDCQQIFGCITVLIAARWLQGIRFLVEMGRRSLQLYLLHPLVNVAATFLLSRLLPWPLAMVLAFATTVGVTYMLALLSERIAWSAYIFGIPEGARAKRVSGIA
jgi:fucose 4-O-acetylase-like acetyltransferase